MPYVTIDIENDVPNPEGYIIVNPKMSVTPDGFEAYDLLCKIVKEQQASDNPILKWSTTPSPAIPNGFCGLLRPECQLLIRADASKEELQQLFKGLDVDLDWGSANKPRFTP